MSSDNEKDITIAIKDDKIVDNSMTNEKENLRKSSRRMSKSDAPFLRQLSKSKSFNKVADDINNKNNSNNYIKKFNTSNTNTDLDYKKRKIPLMRSMSLSDLTYQILKNYT